MWGRQARPDGFARAARHTCRKPERGEKDGAGLVFVRKEAMQRMVDEGRFAETSEEGGAMIGTTYEAVEQVRRHFSFPVSVYCHRADTKWFSPLLAMSKRALHVPLQCEPCTCFGPFLGHALLNCLSAAGCCKRADVHCEAGVTAATGAHQGPRCPAGQCGSASTGHQHLQAACQHRRRGS